MPEKSLHAIAFPKLSDAQMEAMETCPITKRKRFRDGEKLFEAGKCECAFYVVKTGNVQIVDETGDTPKTIVMHGPGEFTGEIAQLMGTRSLVDAIARGDDTEVYEVSNEALHRLLNEHPSLGDTILQAFIARRHLLRDSGEFTGARVIGSQYSRDTFRIRDFLTKNRVPFTWIDVETDKTVRELLKQFKVSESETPVVALGTQFLLRNPTERELADALGLRRMRAGTEVFDLVIVGGGPAGLAAAVYAASEGLRTIVLERVAAGGQAGRSMRIENYLGFPTGITGAELAERAVIQAEKFGAQLPVATPVTRLAFDNAYPVLHLDGDAELQSITGKTLLIATGADYRLLDVPGCLDFEGRGVYYAATPIEAQMCKGCDVIVVGGGNSAGQAAVYMAGQVKKVYLVVRADDLYKGMSSYLVKRIEELDNVEVMLDTVIEQMSGNGQLGKVALANRKSGEKRTIETFAVFSFIGAAPRTDWLPPEIELDPKKFVCTGPVLANSKNWSLKRQPFILETSRPGVFAAGDVRSGSAKRVAAAVGEGAMAVQLVHEYLKQM